MMTTNSGDRLYFCNCEHESWQCRHSLCSRKKYLRGRIVETSRIFENTPPPHFGLDVIYKMEGGGGGINGTLRIQS